MAKQCIECEKRPRFSKGLCIYCDKIKNPDKYLIKKSKIKISDYKVSDKRAKEMKSYATLRKLFLDANPECACGGKIEGCDGMAVDIHHTYSGANRSEHFLDVKTWLGVTRNCHIWIHEHSKEAREMGLLK